MSRMVARRYLGDAGRMLVSALREPHQINIAGTNR